MKGTVLTAATAILISSGAVDAATVTLGYLHRVTGDTIPAQTEAFEVKTIADTAAETNTTFSISATTVPSSGPELERAESFASVDVLTGAMKASVAMKSSFDPLGPGLSGYPGSASSEATLVEQFTVSGSGNITFFLDVTGSWSGESDSGVSNFYSAQLLLNSPFVVDVISPTPSTPLSGSLSERLSVTGFFNDGATAQVQSSLTLIVPTGNKGQLDFSNTAFLSFITDPGVSIAFSDPDFLTVSPSPTTPVPLPAPAALLIAGFGALFGLGRFRKMG